MERNATGNELNNSDNVCQKKLQRAWNMLLSPVYVQRSEAMPIQQNQQQNGKKNINRDSGTQTSKTIIELAKLDAGYISPDSLNSSPRSTYDLLQPEREYNSKQIPFCEHKSQIMFCNQNLSAQITSQLHYAENTVSHRYKHVEFHPEQTFIIDNHRNKTPIYIKSEAPCEHMEGYLHTKHRINGENDFNSHETFSDHKRSASEVNLTTKRNNSIGNRQEYWPQLIQPPSEPTQDSDFKFEKTVNKEDKVTTIYNRDDIYSTICEEDTSNSRETYNMTTTSSASNCEKLHQMHNWEDQYFISTKNKELQTVDTNKEVWCKQIFHQKEMKSKEHINTETPKFENWREEMYTSISTEQQKNIGNGSNELPESKETWREIPPFQEPLETRSHEMMPKTPLNISLMDHGDKASQNRLIDEFLTQKGSNLKPGKKQNSFIDPNKFKSRSFVDAAANRKTFPDVTSAKKRSRKTETKSIETEKDKRILHFYKQKEALKKAAEIEGDRESIAKTEYSNYSGFQSKRSNSFMSPTLASEQKSLKQVVDSVKNLVSMTCRGRSVSPQSQPPQTVKIPYIDESQAELTPRLAKSEELSKHEKYNKIPMAVCSESSIVGSTASSDNGIFIILSHIKSPDWNFALKGLAELLDIGRNSDPETLLPFLTLSNQRLLELLRSPRSHVCRTACQLAGHFFEVMKDTRRPEFDDIVNLLLYKTADANKFIRQDANLALDCMVTHVPTFHAIRSLCAKGPTHRNPLVRCAAIRLIICAVVIAEPSNLLNNPNHEHSRRRIILNLNHFLEDKNLDTRKYAERLYKILAKESNFEFYLKKYLDRNKLDNFHRIVRYVRKT